jgi:hypothetical protein
MLSNTPTTNGHAGNEPDPDSPRFLDIDLYPAIEANGKTYAILHLEEPTGRMVQRAEQELGNGGNMGSLRAFQIALVSNAAGVPRSVVEQMRISQIRKAADFLASFISGGPEIGES